MTSDFMHKIELAWAAGFWDGEGCLTTVDNGKGNRYPQINISQAHPEVLVRFHKAMGVGAIHGPYETKKENWSEMYYYRVSHRQDQEIVIENLYDRVCSVKRQQIDRIMSQVKDARHYSRRLTHEQVAAVISDYKSGMGYIQLALKYNKTYDAIVKLISSKRKRGLV